MISVYLKVVYISWFYAHVFFFIDNFICSIFNLSFIFLYDLPSFFSERDIRSL